MLLHREKPQISSSWGWMRFKTLKVVPSYMTFLNGVCDSVLTTVLKCTVRKKYFWTSITFY